MTFCVVDPATSRVKPSVIELFSVPCNSNKFSFFPGNKKPPPYSVDQFSAEFNSRIIKTINFVKNVEV